MSTFTCTECNKSFSTALGLAGHSRMHGTSGGTNKQIMCCCVITKKVLKVNNLVHYQFKLEPCAVCNKLFKRRKDRNHCSPSCVATARNLSRTLSAESEARRRANIASSIKRLAKQRNPLLFDPEGPFSKVRFAKCRITGKLYVSVKGSSRVPSPYYSVSSITKYRRRCAFKFKLSSYPAEFVCDQPIYSGKRNPNMDAYSRDHMFSVSDGHKLNIDPKLIAHPANCRLIKQRINLDKRHRSCITLDELINRIQVWDLKYPK